MQKVKTYLYAVLFSYDMFDLVLVALLLIMLVGGATLILVAAQTGIVVLRLTFGAYFYLHPVEENEDE